MKDGFVKVGTGTVTVKVADPDYNKVQIIEMIKEAAKRQIKLLVLPELCITAYTCNDLFWHQKLLKSAEAAFCEILMETAEYDMLICLGLPVTVNHNLFNCAAFFKNGEILGVVPKMYLPNYSEFYEARYFTPGNREVIDITLCGQKVPFGMNLLFTCENMPELVVGCEICEDLWVPLPPSTWHALAGATVICNPSASDETTTKESYRRSLVSNQSARTVSAYLYASAGDGESTQDVVYSGHNLISENGSILAESKRFVNQLIEAEIDLDRLVADRRKMTTYTSHTSSYNNGNHTINYGYHSGNSNYGNACSYVDGRDAYTRVYFSLEEEETPLTRYFAKTPFIPSSKIDRDNRCDEILMIQAMGLKKRFEHTRCQSAVVGISGGLDSTLAVLVMARAFDLLGIPRENMLCVTMPCFGTTDRTYHNACALVEKLGGTLREIRINKAVEQHFLDINHDPSLHDVTYENSQARERTQILMDLANQTNGMVIGTGDMSELALGWATYNGDHMSMYAVNSSVPKSLVRHLVRYYADTCNNADLANVLLDILDTPVSPELLPPVDGIISQKTEDLVGPYELHDFFLYYLLRFGYGPSKIFRVCKLAYGEEYDDATIYKWLRTFHWRFFAQHFKRSCLPDGPKVGSIAVSPRGDLRMPSDASSAIWMSELDELKKELGCF